MINKLASLGRFFGQFDQSMVDVPKVDANQSQIQSVMTIVFQTAAVLAVLIIVIAGFSYVISQGDPQRTNRAKDAILYALIGLVISILGYTIVAFVITETAV